MNQDVKSKLNELRKAHFVVGFSTDPSRSNYQDDYIKRNPNNKFPQTEEAKYFQQYISNPRKAHFNVGDDQINYDSIAKLSYDQKEIQKAQLSDETKKDLRSHHFKLGFHSVPHETEYQEFKKAELEKQQNKQINTRKHHHDFGDLKTYFQTSYNTNHNAKPIIKEEIYHQDMRKTNIKIGDQIQNFETHGSVFLKGQQNQPTKLNQELKVFLKQSHIELGTEQYNTQSQTKDTYRGLQPQGFNNQSNELSKDLRQAHFDLAYQKSDIPNSTAQSTFKQFGIQLAKPAFHKNSFQIGNAYAGSEKIYNTNYNSNYQNPHTKIPEFKKDERIGSVDFGHEQVDYQTEQTDKYKAIKKLEPLKLDQKVVNDLRSSHIQFGEDKIDYSRPLPSTKGVNNNLDQDIIKDLRGEHYVYGNQLTQYNPHNSEYGLKQGPPNRLSKETASELRKHHYQEEGQTNYKTSYQAMRQ